MKNIKLKGNQIKLLINFISIAIFAFCYFYVYTGYVDKTEAANIEIDMVKQSIIERENKLSEEDNVLTNIDTVNDQMQTIIDGFPVYIAKEDNYMFIEQMEKALNITFSNINVTDSTELFKTIIPISSTDNISVNETTTKGTEAETLTGRQTIISMNFVTSYNGFKKLVDYIKNYPDKTLLDSTTVSYDSTTGNLTGSLVLKRFALTGTDKIYKMPYIDDISIGTDNIFGTNPEPLDEIDQSEQQAEVTQE